MAPIQIGAIWVQDFVGFLQVQVAKGPPRETQGCQNWDPRAAKSDTREAQEPPGVRHQWQKFRLVPFWVTDFFVSC